MSMTLKVTGLSKAFGSVCACDRIQLTASEATSTAIVGPNGAGKTTLMNIIGGDILPDDGQVYWIGHPLIGLSVPAIARLGVARMFQDLKVFDAMTVFENLTVYADSMAKFRAKNPEGFLKGSELPEQLVERALDRLGLVSSANRYARDLSYAERKLVALARVMVTKAGLVLLDEPASGLDKKSINIVIGVIQTLRSEGAVMLVVEHNLAIVEQIASRVLLIETGSIVADGPARSVFNDSSFGRVYFSMSAQ